MTTDQQLVRKAIDNKEWAGKWRIIEGIKLLWTDLGQSYTLLEIVNIIESEIDDLIESGALASDRYRDSDKRYNLAISNILKRTST